MRVKGARFRGSCLGDGGQISRFEQAVRFIQDEKANLRAELAGQGGSAGAGAGFYLGERQNVGLHQV